MIKNCKVKQVTSANKLYLFVGLMSILFIIILEAFCIYEFKINSYDELGLILLLQIPVLMCLLMSTTLKDYMHREIFNLYLAELNSGLDIDYIKDNYIIVNINEYFVLFVEKDDENLYYVWKLFHDDNLYRLYVNF